MGGQEELRIYFKAPFAVFRSLSVDRRFKPTVGFLTPSAAYGLLLNLACLEMRDGSGIREDLPIVDLAIGAVRHPEHHQLLQQIHYYTVGEDDGKEKKGLLKTKGHKRAIGPARRSFLGSVEGCVCIQSNAALLEGIRKGLRGEKNDDRYGLPFLGNNNFMLERLEEVPRGEGIAAHWYVPIEPPARDDVDLDLERSTFMTDRVNRTDPSRAITRQYAPTRDKQEIPPAEAWMKGIGYNNSRTSS